LIQALKPNGLLFYQTFTRTCVNDCGPKNPEFRLRDNELLLMFADLQVVVYQEEACIGDTTQGLRNEALLIAVSMEIYFHGDQPKIGFFSRNIIWITIA